MSDGNLRGREAFEAAAREIWGFAPEEVWPLWQAACRACADACEGANAYAGRDPEYVRDDCADACRALGGEG